MSPSLLLLVVFTPSAAALLVRLVQRPKLGRAIANASVLATLLLSGMLALAVGAHPEEGLHWTSEALALPGARWSFGVDALGAPFLPLASAIASIVLIAGPRHELDREAIVTLLLTLSGILGVMASFDLLQLALFWVASLVPGSLDLRRRSRERPSCRASRVYDIFLVLGAIPMIATVALVGVARAGRRVGGRTMSDLATVVGGATAVGSSEPCRSWYSGIPWAALPGRSGASSLFQFAWHNKLPESVTSSANSEASGLIRPLDSVVCGVAMSVVGCGAVSGR